MAALGLERQQHSRSAPMPIEDFTSSPVMACRPPRNFFPRNSSSGSQMFRRLGPTQADHMLCVNTYTKDYVNSCRSKIEAQLAAYRVLAGAAREKAGDSSASAATFEPLFFNNLVLVLDRLFVHRARGLEGKDGNPLNEVRMLCDSILQKDGVTTADKTIKFDPAKSVLRLQPGDEIRLSEADFVRLSNAFFAEIAAKFT
jgi:hypothetical protein